MPTTNPTHQFNFNDSGNRLSAVTPALGTVNYTSSNTNAYTMITGDQPSYDSNGNTTSLRGRSLTWDRKDRMRANGNIEYIHDALGRMVQRKNTTTGVTHRYSWSGWLMISEQKKNASGVETEFLRYTWGADLTGSLEGAGTVGGLLMIERFAAGGGTAQVAHVHPDANGNTMGTTSDTGAMLTWYKYHPFGQVESEGGNSDWLGWNRFKFSTKYLDAETGLYYYGYRYYDPVTGRWPSRDPIEEDGGNNLYGFVGNDGVNNSDLLGNERLTDEEEGDCHDKIDKSLESPKIKGVLVSMRRKRCKAPLIYCNCCDNRNSGTFSGSRISRKKNGVIEICYNNLKRNGRTLEEVLHHELIHALQYCSGKADQDTDCRTALCHEIEAYSKADAQCAKFAIGTEGHKACVKGEYKKKGVGWSVKDRCTVAEFDQNFDELYQKCASLRH
ncbi:MAG: hypothetical protein H7A51_18440 [Akkermansiaceae bacterium]|nr:hypothetical protein [Akkermansiaceae bacterium]